MNCCLCFLTIAEMVGFHTLDRFCFDHQVDVDRFGQHPEQLGHLLDT